MLLRRCGFWHETVQFAAVVASFGMLLRGSEHAGQATYDDVVEIANDNLGDDQWGYRKEFVGLAQRARTLVKE